MRRLLLVYVAGVIAVSGCRKPADPEPELDHARGGEAAGTSAQTDEDLDAPLAVIDDVVITVREFQERLDHQSPYVRARYASLEKKKEFLDNLVRFEVLAKEAKKRGLDQHPDVIRTMKQVMIQKLIKEEFESRVRLEDITDEELRAYYDANQAEYDKPEEVRVAAIVVEDAGLAARVAREARGEKGQTNKGFRDLVATYSVDEATKIRGGDLRYFARDTEEYPRPVVDAAFALAKTGDVAGPIQAGSAYYVIKQTGKRKAVKRSFDQVKRQIQNRLFRDKRSAAQRAFLDELRSRAEIEIHEDNLAKVRVNTAPPSSETGHGGHGHPLPGLSHPEGDHDHGDGLGQRELAD